MAAQYGSSLPHHARTKAAWCFLETKNTHLFWIDSDIVWEGADFLRFLALGTKLECVCGAYPVKRDPPTFMLSSEDPGKPLEANEFGCLPIGGIGMGFTIVQRKVMEQLAAKAPLLRFPEIDNPIPHIFRCDDSNGDARGEDMAYFADIRGLGYTVWLDPNITLGHVGPKTYSASMKDHLVPQQ